MAFLLFLEVPPEGHFQSSDGGKIWAKSVEKRRSYGIFSVFGGAAGGGPEGSLPVVGSAQNFSPKISIPQGCLTKNFSPIG